MTKCERQADLTYCWTFLSRDITKCAPSMDRSELESKLDAIEELSNNTLPVYCLCQRGVASVEATRIIQQSIDEGKRERIHSVYNVDGELKYFV
jgi:hypothetical protein